MPERTLKIALCQLNLTTGDFEGNFRKAEKAVWENEADIYVFPECQVANYPSDDLYLHRAYVADAMSKVDDYVRLSAETGKTLVFGCPVPGLTGNPYNAVVLAENGRMRIAGRKSHLPNYGVFDDERWFAREWEVVESLYWQGEGFGLNLGFCVCEDIWFSDVTRALAKYGADILVSINSSPYSIAKAPFRRNIFRQRVHETGVPLVYVNQVGGNDELVWDGASAVLDPDGSFYEAHPWAETVDVVVLERRGGRWRLATTKEPVAQPFDAERYVAACIGLRDYMAKTGFRRAVLGLSGGADSALVGLMAADALGPENVHFVMMPTDFTSGASNELAMDLAAGLGSDSCFVAVQPLFNAYQEAMSAAYGVTAPNVAEENLQAQIRGDLLSWHSNKFGAMILSTGNKSEIAMGYATLYGDMRGGFNPLKDLYKTEAFELLEMRLGYALGTRDDFGELFGRSLGRAPAALRKRIDHDGPKALRAIIDRPPSAELAEGQLDSDSLPDYAVLDKILWAMIDHKESLDNGQVAEETGQPLALVEEVRRRMRVMEYKRFQSCPGPKIHRKSFTKKDWRLPMASAYRS